MQKSLFIPFPCTFAFFIISEDIFGDINCQKWAFMQKVTSDIFGLKWAVFVELQRNWFSFVFVNLYLYCSVSVESFILEGRFSHYKDDNVRSIDWPYWADRCLLIRMTMYYWLTIWPSTICYLQVNQSNLICLIDRNTVHMLTTKFEPLNNDVYDVVDDDKNNCRGWDRNTVHRLLQKILAGVRREVGQTPSGS